MRAHARRKTMALHIEALTGGYTNFPIIKDVSFEVKDGETVGLIGLNGAGKSTTIKHIMGLLEPFSGNISVNGQTIQQNPQAYRQQIAYVPEAPALYEELTLKEHIDITAISYNLLPMDYEEEAKNLLKTFRLDGRLDWFPSNFSKGMQQKVMVVCALLSQPELLVIDEPFTGLDPIAVRDLLRLLDEKKETGVSILMSTHVLSTAERYCDRFVVLHEGKVKAQGTLSELRESFDMPDASLDDLYIKATE